MDTEHSYRHKQPGVRAAPALQAERVYVHAGLDDAPLILAFEQQLAQQQEAEAVLSQITARVEFELACLLRGVDPRPAGRG